jgi:peptidoglycan hydrolase-like protein with peptidoglycan-binding domain
MTIIGPDYASVDGNTPPNLLAAKSAGAGFVIPRAIYGRPITTGSAAPFRDPVWVRDKNTIVEAGLVRGAFLFVCYPKHGVFTPEPEDQAQALIDYADLVQYKDFVPMFDVEERSNVLNADEMYAWTLRVAVKLREHYGAWPGMYTSALDWHEMMHDHAAGDLINCPLWIAKPWPWKERTPAHLDGLPSSSPLLIPPWGNQWFFYQYQGDALSFPGFDKTVDISRARVFGKGAKGDHVVWMQHRLGITADGDFGPQTDSAIRALQSMHNLTVDGFVGPATFAVLCWMNS